MRARPTEPGLYAVDGGVLSLSGPAFRELLEAVLERGRPLRFRAGGFSMEPFIRDGDVLTVGRPPSGGPRIGDVVAFLRPHTETLVIHRVVGASRRAYIMKGDNSWTTDGAVPRAGVLGVVIRVERHGREVRFGLGPERRVIALLARWGCLQPLTFRLHLVGAPSADACDGAP